MTIPSEQRFVEYLGDGVDTSFDVPFFFRKSAHLRVTRLPGEGESIPLALDVDYTLQGEGTAEGVVSLIVIGELGPEPVALLPGVTLRIERVLPYTQERTFPTNGSWSAKTLEHALDDSLSLAQQTRDTSEETTDALAALDADLSPRVMLLETGLSAETQARTAADVAEASARVAVFNTLTASLTAETAAREDADDALASTLSAEQAARAAGDASLTSSVSTLTGRVEDLELTTGFDVLGVGALTATSSLTLPDGSQLNAAPATAAALQSEAAARASADNTIIQAVGDLVQVVNNNHTAQTSATVALTGRVSDVEDEIAGIQSGSYVEKYGGGAAIPSFGTVQDLPVIPHEGGFFSGVLAYVYGVEKLYVSNSAGGWDEVGSGAGDSVPVVNGAAVFPRVTNAESLPNPVGGELVYVESDGRLYQSNGATWLPVANVTDIDGSGVSVGGILGAIQFSNGNGGLAVDESNLMWDDANNRLGIGTHEPATPVDVNGVIRSRVGGFRFPDDTVQTTAATGVNTSQTIASSVAAGEYGFTLPVNARLGLNGAGDAHISYDTAVIALSKTLRVASSAEMGATGFKTFYSACRVVSDHNTNGEPSLRIGSNANRAAGQVLVDVVNASETVLAKVYADGTLEVPKLAAASGAGVALMGRVATFGSEAAVVSDNENYLEADQKIHSFRSLGTERAYINANGYVGANGIRFGDNTTQTTAAVSPDMSTYVTKTGVETLSGKTFSDTAKASALEGLASSTLTLRSSVPNGASAVAHVVDTTAAYSTSGAKLLSVRTGGTEKLQVDKDGGLAFTIAQATATVNPVTSPEIRLPSSSWFSGAPRDITWALRSNVVSSAAHRLSLYVNSVQKAAFDEAGRIHCFGVNDINGAPSERIAFGSSINTYTSAGSDSGYGGHLFALGTTRTAGYIAVFRNASDRAYVMFDGTLVLLGAASTSGAQTNDSPAVTLRGTYWNGAASATREFNLVTDVTAADGSAKLSVRADGAEKVSIDRDGAIASAGSMKPATHTVASLPSAATAGAGAMLYCSNGDAGAPCLVVSDGATWRRVALGATASAT